MPPGEEESIASHALVGGKDHPEFKTCEFDSDSLNLFMTDLLHSDRYRAQSVLKELCSMCSIKANFIYIWPAFRLHLLSFVHQLLM